jgi:hypothetical protein
VGWWTRAESDVLQQKTHTHPRHRVLEIVSWWGGEAALVPGLIGTNRGGTDQAKTTRPASAHHRRPQCSRAATQPREIHRSQLETSAHLVRDAVCGGVTKEGGALRGVSPHCAVGRDPARGQHWWGAFNRPGMLLIRWGQAVRRWQWANRRGGGWWLAALG